MLFEFVLICDPAVGLREFLIEGFLAFVILAPIIFEWNYEPLMFLLYEAETRQVSSLPLSLWTISSVPSSLEAHENKRETITLFN